MTKTLCQIQHNNHTSGEGGRPKRYMTDMTIMGHILFILRNRGREAGVQKF